jgi:hypothetical protein
MEQSKREWVKCYLSLPTNLQARPGLGNYARKARRIYGEILSIDFGGRLLSVIRPRRMGVISGFSTN